MPSRRLVLLLVALTSQLGALHRVPAAAESIDVELVATAAGFVEPVRVRVFLPDGTPPERGWPVVVFLHGFGQDQNAFAELGGPEGVKELRAERRFVVAAPYGGTEVFADAHGAGPSWSRLLVDVLMPALADRVPTLDRELSLAMHGVSAGGAKALAVALAHPDRVTCVSAHSAAIHPPDPADLPDWARGWEGWAYAYGDPIDIERWRRDNPIWLAAHMPPEGLRAIGIRFDVGADDHLGFQSTAGELAAALAAAGVPFTFAVRPGGHGEDFYRSVLPGALEFQANCLARRAGGD